MLEKTELPEFICRFLRRIYDDSTTHVEVAGTTRGQFLVARGVRQGCPASGFLFCNGFSTLSSDGSKRQSSQGILTTWICCSQPNALTLTAFLSVDHIAGLNSNYRKCCGVQNGSEGRESLLHWLSDNCEEFREMQIARHAKYVGTVIGPDGFIHRWTAHRKKSSSAC